MTVREFSDPFEWRFALARRVFNVLCVVAFFALGWFPIAIAYVVLHQAHGYVSDRLIHYQRELIQTYKSEEALRSD